MERVIDIEDAAGSNTTSTALDVEVPRSCLSARSQFFKYVKDNCLYLDLLLLLQAKVFNYFKYM